MSSGEPKPIPWSHTTPIKCAVDGYFHHDIRSGEVVAWPTNIGWMMGAAIASLVLILMLSTLTRLCLHGVCKTSHSI
jgi:acyl-coenzyme A synthetase/AMP-(fatty) acid ligase